MKKRVEPEIVFEKEFSVDEYADKFQKWMIEELNKRTTKKGKLFDFAVSPSSIMFGETHMLSGGGFGMNPFDHMKISLLYELLVERCMKICGSTCEEYGAQIEIDSIPNAQGSIVKIIRKDNQIMSAEKIIRKEIDERKHEQIDKLLKDLYWLIYYADIPSPTIEVYIKFHEKCIIYKNHVNNIIKCSMKDMNSLLRILKDLRNLIIINDVYPSSPERKEIHENYMSFISGISDIMEVVKEEY